MSQTVNKAIEILRGTNNTFMDQVVESNVDDEGFRPKPYQDTKKVWTFGHGLTWISREESEVVVRMRLDDIRKQINERIKNLSPARQLVLINMAYNLGVEGLYEFKDMWAAIEAGNFDLAAAEMLDSLWAEQVGDRDLDLAKIMREG